MAVKFKITGARIAEVCSIAEYLLLQAGNTEMIIRLAPRFVLGDDDKYIVTANIDNDGDIVGFEGMSDAFMKMSQVTPSRLQKLSKDFSEAVKNIINPQSGAG